MRGKESEDKSVSCSKHHGISDIPMKARPEAALVTVGTSMTVSGETLDRNESENHRQLKQPFPCIKLTPKVKRVPDFITHLGETPRESPRNVSFNGVNSSNQDEGEHESMETYQESRGTKETASSESCSSEDEFEEDAISILQTMRIKMLEEFRAAEVQRTAEWNRRRKVESEESERKMALASERQKELEVSSPNCGVAERTER